MGHDDDLAIGFEAEVYAGLPSGGRSGCCSNRCGLVRPAPGSRVNPSKVHRTGWPQAGAGVQFSTAGTHFAWGSTDGFVTVCNLNEFQQQLAEVGLGW